MHDLTNHDPAAGELNPLGSILIYIGMSMESQGDFANDKAVKALSKWSNTLKWYFVLSGPLLIIFGLIHVFGILTDGFTYVRLADAIFNSAFGIVWVVCAILYRNRKQLVLWIYGSSIVISIIYSYAMGRGFNYSMAIIGGFFTYQLYRIVKSEGMLRF